MATENLQVQYSAASSFNSEAWEVVPVWPGRPMLRGSMQVIWDGLDVFDGRIEIEISNDEVNWNCYGGGTGCVLDNASDNLIFEFTHFTARYYRLAYTRVSATTGTITIRTHGTQQRKE